MISTADASASAGPRFRFTGQIALPEARLYHYRARVYDPTLGRLLQTDPFGYTDEQNRAFLDWEIKRRA